MVKDRSRPQHSYKPSRRLAPKRTLWIFCEGHFEKRYFEHLRNNARLPGELLKIRVEELGHEGDARKMLEQARKEIRQDREANHADHIICLVFDCEPHDRARCDINRSVYTQLEQEQARSSDERGFVSYPCFEVWPLLHRCEELKGLNKAETAKDRFKREFKQASTPNFDFRLLTGQEVAIQRSERIWKGVQGFPSFPATSIHMLLELVEQLKKPVWTS